MNDHIIIVVLTVELVDFDFLRTVLRYPTITLLARLTSSSMLLAVTILSVNC